MTNKNLQVIDNPSDLAVVTQTPREMIALAAERANVLMEVVEAKKLYANIGGKKYLEAPAWQIIAAFDRAFCCTEWSRPIERDGQVIGVESKVALVKDGQTLSSAIMSCGFEEFPCRGKQGQAKYRAAESASQTWAGAKATKMAYSWVAVLGGFEPTPAEEMLVDQGTGEIRPAPKPAQRPVQAQTRPAAPAAPKSEDETTRFFREAGEVGYTPQQALGALGVKVLPEWLASHSGKTLADALSDLKAMKG